MLNKLRKIAQTYFATKIKFNLEKIELKSVTGTRKGCRKLKESGGLVLVTKKGSTRHKRVKSVVKTDKKLWMEQVRKLRTKLRNLKSEMNLTSKLYRSAYRYIKSNRIDTSKKLNLYLNVSKTTI